MSSFTWPFVEKVGDQDMVVCRGDVSGLEGGDVSGLEGGDVSGLEGGDVRGWSVGM